MQWKNSEAVRMLTHVCNVTSPDSASQGRAYKCELLAAFKESHKPRYFPGSVKRDPETWPAHGWTQCCSV